MSYLRVLSNPNYQCGLDGNFADFPELRDWPEQAAFCVDEMILRMNPNHGWARSDFADLPGILNGAGDQAIILIHPLWDQCNPRGILLDSFAAAMDVVPAEGISFIDTFNALRRPTWSMTMENRLSSGAR